MVGEQIPAINVFLSHVTMHASKRVKCKDTTKRMQVSLFKQGGNYHYRIALTLDWSQYSSIVLFLLFLCIFLYVMKTNRFTHPMIWGVFIFPLRASRFRAVVDQTFANPFIAAWLKWQFIRKLINCFFICTWQKLITPLLSRLFSGVWHVRSFAKVLKTICFAWDSQVSLHFARMLTVFCVVHA